MRLFLKFEFHTGRGTPGQLCGQVFPEESHGVALIRIDTQSHPNKVQMIRHENIGRAKQTFTRGGMQQQFAESKMKEFIEPAGCTMFKSDCPVNYGKPLVKLRIEPREMMPFRLRSQRDGSHKLNVATIGRERQTENHSFFVAATRKIAALYDHSNGGALPRRRYATP